MSTPLKKSKTSKVKQTSVSPGQLVGREIDALPPRESQELSATFAQIFSSKRPLNEGFSGEIKLKRYSQKERIELELKTLYQFFEERRRLLDSTLTPTQVGKLLNTSRQTAHDRREAGTMLAALDNGVWKYPIWQFDPEGPNGVVDGLPEILQALHVSDLAKIAWLTRKNVILQTTPIAALKRGLKKQVLSEALSVGVS